MTTLKTLKQLQSGELIGSKTLKLASNLEIFPKEILDLHETLEYLDLTDNNLSELPDDFAKLSNLKILFLSNNQFTVFPSILSKCKSLSMIGFRNNSIHTLEENALPLTTRWLILTQNNLETLPESMGDLHLLQKCMLSGNRLQCLPHSFSKCANLELLRLSANKLEALPSQILGLPKLSWLAYGGNPFCKKHPSCDTSLKEVHWDRLKIQELLGEGASGLIYKAIYEENEVAVKVFKGDMTSDGLPKEEMDINISMGKHEHLIDVLAKVVGHPDKYDVLMLELVPKTYSNLGLPPTLDTCTRDVYKNDLSLSFDDCLKVLLGMSKAAVHMHNRGIMHGDFYAHNIMIDKNANSILGDFGGASYFEPEEIELRKSLEYLEVRAFGCLIQEMLILSSKDTHAKEEKREQLTHLRELCLDTHPHSRPLFSEILKELTKMTNT
ncbi:MAG: serine/threonine protein kinase [uncultured Sulfurovum sp.]|uniref:Serine/threonine protein kinase n=1 Tax=uncultured Sulfurovum sp. TaxID=269237 RepID=A0A6S6TQG6_9BACT|nr:MAG: serine/threonine protein kinase [uncultured Sulfurovum sp.]